LDVYVLGGPAEGPRA